MKKIKRRIRLLVIEKGTRKRNICYIAFLKFLNVLLLREACTNVCMYEKKDE